MIKLDPQTKINDLISKYPQLIDFLVNEYQFHCIGCFISDFETLQEGAQVHGIVGQDFVQLMKELNEIISKGETSDFMPAHLPATNFQTIIITLPQIYLLGQGVGDYVPLITDIQHKTGILPDKYIDTFNQLLNSYYIDEIKQKDFWEMINENHNLNIDSEYDWFGNNYHPHISKILRIYIDKLREKGKRVVGVMDAGYEQLAILNYGSHLAGFDDLLISGDIGSTVREPRFWQRLRATEPGILLVTNLHKLRKIANELSIPNLLVRKTDNIIYRLENTIGILNSELE